MNDETYSMYKKFCIFRNCVSKFSPIPLGLLKLLNENWFFAAPNSRDIFQGVEKKRQSKKKKRQINKESDSDPMA